MSDHDVCNHNAHAMRSVDKHVDECIAAAIRDVIPTEKIPVAEAAGRIVAEEAVAKLPVPPFSNSAMDGFLVHLDDVSGSGPWTLPVSGDVPAGATAKAVLKGSAVRIMTGAPTGEEIDGLTVIPIEDTTLPPGPLELPPTVTITRAATSPRHVRRRGENVNPGAVIAPAGTRVDPGTLAGLLSVGVTEVEVFRRPRVTVVATGDELVSTGEAPGEGQIVDSNSPMLAQLARETGLASVRQLKVSDAAADVVAIFDEILRNSDLVVTSGGVSAGAFDVVKEVLEHRGVWFGPVKMQPGKPQGLGRIGNTTVLCLPGNPVSSFVSFHLFATPVIAHLAGMDTEDRRIVDAELELPIAAPKGRDLFIPARTRFGGIPTVRPASEGHFGSHFVASLSGVNCLIHVPAGSGPRATGDTVTVILL